MEEAKITTETPDKTEQLNIIMEEAKITTETPDKTTFTNIEID